MGLKAAAFASQVGAGVVDGVGTAVAMGAVAIAPDFKWLAIASVLVGAMSITHHLILPFAAQVAPSGKRGNSASTVRFRPRAFCGDEAKRRRKLKAPSG